MKQKNITATNVDDFIRERKKSGSKSIRWSTNGLKHFQAFWNAVLPCEHGWFCLCGGGERSLNDKDKGMTFMGIKHYWK